MSLKDFVSKMIQPDAPGLKMFLVFLVDFCLHNWLNVEKNKGYLFFRNPPPQISTFSLGQKGCPYYGKSAYYECAYYDRAQLLKSGFNTS